MTTGLGIGATSSLFRGSSSMGKPRRIDSVIADEYLSRTACLRSIEIGQAHIQEARYRTRFLGGIHQASTSF